MWIAMYECNQGYGGDEEGGWWFDCGTLIKSRRLRSRENYQKILKNWIKKADELNRKEDRLPTSSVNCDGYYKVWLDDKKPVEGFPDFKPHYE